MRLASIETLVGDEADRMMDVGFVPDLRRLVAVLSRTRPSRLFSATRPLPLPELAYAELLRDLVHVEVNTLSAPPATLSQSLYLIPSAQKTDLRLNLLQQEMMGSVLQRVLGHSCRSARSGAPQRWLGGHFSHYRNSGNARSAEMQ